MKERWLEIYKAELDDVWDELTALSLKLREEEGSNKVRTAVLDARSSVGDAINEIKYLLRDEA